MSPLPARSLALSSALALLSLAVFGQSAKAPSTNKLPSVNDTVYKEKIRFIQGAPCLLPLLVQEREWDQVKNYLDHWRVSPVPSEEFIFSISTLAAIDQRKFFALTFPYNYEALLQNYAYGAKNVYGAFRYYLRITDRFRYDATPDAKSLILWIEAWSRNLLARDSLSPTEKFLCQVFAGDIVDPQATLQKQNLHYGDLYALQHNIERSYQDYFVAERNRPGPTVSIMTGIWVPTGHLTTLGTHPSIGISLGSRNVFNEYEFVWAFRFPGSSTRPYTFARNDSVFTSHYYDGGYVGLDYTRYIVHKTRYEFGLVSAIAYDYFSVANGFGGGEAEDHHWGSLNQGSFDFNNGFRFKYFLRPRLYVGLAVKYHIINYVNNGGTDMGGNAVTMDLALGTR